VRGRTIGVFNLGGDYYALLDRCPHQGGRLCLGEAIGLVQSREPGTYDYSRPGEMLKCPWHGWEFDIRTGQSWCDPKDTRVRTYPVAVEPGESLVKGPYVAETVPVSIEQDFVVLDV
jgi:3-phenylpropionate/trans-cinnamate dioxygenase ferredoxin subunit